MARRKMHRSNGRNDGDLTTWAVGAAIALLGLLAGVPFAILWLMETSLEQIVTVFCQIGLLGAGILAIVCFIAFLKFFGDP